MGRLCQALLTCLILLLASQQDQEDWACGTARTQRRVVAARRRCKPSSAARGPGPAGRSLAARPVRARGRRTSAATCRRSTQRSRSTRPGSPSTHSSPPAAAQQRQLMRSRRQGAPRRRPRRAARGRRARRGGRRRGRQTRRPASRQRGRSAAGRRRGQRVPYRRRRRRRVPCWSAPAQARATHSCRACPDALMRISTPRHTAWMARHTSPHVRGWATCCAPRRRPGAVWARHRAGGSGAPGVIGLKPCSSPAAAGPDAHDG